MAGREKAVKVGGEGMQLLQGDAGHDCAADAGGDGARNLHTRLRHGWSKCQKLLNLNQGTLYPALVRLEQYGWIAGEWGRTENNREAKFYAITKAGVKALGEETARWRQMMGLVERLLNEDGELRGCVPAGGCVVSELYKVLCNRPSEEENRHRWQSTTH
jgi:PadR family transcriptional regulator PadR